ncbi:hypothetical protein K469DRAFT_730664 [Zopfia rhizophila CBS 207.26]|uniref:Uncharacterized protein n=1 Tax=Zopfia rhizophila CBS 207.26 TaxID=1314779 RepID=A0A6A6DIQ9_9PEZI|nr:hypothetical protein K469DRAFT_730664 [Zopfia rhizophila CBS 207.26]
MPRQNQWFVPGDGIAREVITADIQRYLGPDALGVPGYWITAYRTLTTQMIQDLKLDSQRWRAEAGRGSPYVRDHKVARQPDSSIVAYQDSRTHASRQHYGPSASAQPVEYPQTHGDPPRTAYSSASGYTSSEHSAYTTTPSQYAPQQSSYQVPQYSAPPRTQPDPYGYQQQQGRESHPSYAQQPQYYYQQPTSEPPRQPSYAPQGQRYFGYFDDHFLVYR